MKNNTDVVAVIAKGHTQNMKTVLIRIVILTITIGIYYGYVHYLKLSLEWAGIRSVGIGSSIVYLFCENQNVFTKITCILLLMWVSGHTGVLMVHTGIIS